MPPQPLPQLDRAIKAKQLEMARLNSQLLHLIKLRRAHEKESEDEKAHVPPASLLRPPPLRVAATSGHIPNDLV